VDYPFLIVHWIKSLALTKWDEEILLTNRELTADPHIWRPDFAEAAPSSARRVERY